jgi:hypothetical protein
MALRWQTDNRNCKFYIYWHGIIDAGDATGFIVVLLAFGKSGRGPWTASASFLDFVCACGRVLLPLVHAVAAALTFQPFLLCVSPLPPLILVSPPPRSAQAVYPARTVQLHLHMRALAH